MQLKDFPQISHDPYDRAEKICKKARWYHFCVLAVCVLAQLTLDSSIKNIESVLIVFLISLASFNYIVRASIFRVAPVPSLIVLGFDIATMSGALVVQTLDLTSLVYNLAVPEHTFQALALFQIALLSAFVCFVRVSIFFRISSTINSKLFVPLGLLREPLPLQLWIMGAFGLMAVIWNTLVGFTGEVKFGDVGAKFVSGFNYLAYAPFLLPMLPYVFQKPEKNLTAKTNFIMLLAYFAVLALVGIAGNTRGGFAGPIANLGLIMVVLIALGQLDVTRKMQRLLAIVAVLVVMTSSVISDIAIAMVVVRAERDHSTSTQMISKTFDSFQNKKELESHQKFEERIAGQGEYEENYISNPFLGRLILTKFTDNMLALHDVRNGRHTEALWLVTEQTLIALLPTPMMRFFGFSLDKENIRFSMGDALYDAQYGIGLGYYKVGSSVAHGLALMGAVAYVLAVPIFLITFIAVQSLTLLKFHIVVISPVILLQLMSLYYLAAGDSFFGPIIFLVRTLPQNILIYILAFQVARLLAFWLSFRFNKKKSISRNLSSQMR